MKRCFYLATTLSLLLIFLVGCSDDNVIIEPAGAVEYFISNQTSDDIMVTFITSAELGQVTVDTVPVITVGMSRLILRDGIIGVNPQPTNSFSELTFVRSNDLDNPWVLSAITNKDWDIVKKEIGASGYGLTEYQFVVTDDDF